MNFQRFEHRLFLCVLILQSIVLLWDIGAFGGGMFREGGEGAVRGKEVNRVLSFSS